VYGVAALSAAAPWWAPRVLSPGEATDWQVGAVAVRVTRHALDWEVSVRRGDEPEVTTRLALADGGGQVTVAPVLPAGTILVCPPSPWVLPPGRSMTCFPAVPFFLRICVGPEVAMEVPSRAMRRAWIGPTTAGSLGHAWVADAPTRPGPAEPDLVVVPTELVHRGGHTWTLTRLPVPAGALRLFAAAGRLWAPEVSVTITDDDGPRVSAVADAAPVEAGAAIALAEPRRPGIHAFAERVIEGLLR
jgi:hypothetical protein